jgi:hypothetical protein
VDSSQNLHVRSSLAGGVDLRIRASSVARRSSHSHGAGLSDGSTGGGSLLRGPGDRGGHGRSWLLVALVSIGDFGGLCWMNSTYRPRSGNRGQGGLGWPGLGRDGWPVSTDGPVGEREGGSGKAGEEGDGSETHVDGVVWVYYVLAVVSGEDDFRRETKARRFAVKDSGCVVGVSTNGRPKSIDAGFRNFDWCSGEEKRTKCRMGRPTRLYLPRR